MKRKQYLLRKKKSLEAQYQLNSDHLIIALKNKDPLLEYMLL